MLQRSKNQSSFIPMASFFAFAAFFFLSFFFFLPTFPATSSFSRSPSPSDTIVLACRATLFPEICVHALRSDHNLPVYPNITRIILSAIATSSYNIKKVMPMITTIYKSSQSNLNRSAVCKICAEVLDCSLHRTQSTVGLIYNLQDNRGLRKDARAWMSAAVQAIYTCWNGMSYVNDSLQVVDTMSFLNNTISHTSNALSLISSFDIYGQDLSRWRPPKTERENFWESSILPKQPFHGGVPMNLPVNVTVCPGCSYTKIQDAVNAAPDNEKTKFVIRIKAGVYVETVRISLLKKNLVFLGDGRDRTKITASAFVKNGVFTYSTATVGVLGDRFMMRGITVENNARPDLSSGPIHQAVALRLDSDKSVIQECEFLGHQDTLYASTLRQYYKLCSITGTVDFIFGNAQAVFHNCNIFVAARQVDATKGEKNTVTAQGRTDMGQITGFVFDGCTVNGTAEYMELYRQNSRIHKAYLGRPWKEYSRTVFLNCYLGDLIRKEGWLQWNKFGFALKTLYYGERGNIGLGADRSERVNWSNLVPAIHVSTYSVENFIQGDLWIPQFSS